MKLSALTFALAASLASLTNSSSAYARVSVSSLDARLTVIEQKTQIIPVSNDDLTECGGSFKTGGGLRNGFDFVDPLTGNVIESLPAPSPATGGFMADTDANTAWDYGYMSSQLYTNDSGKLSCGVVVDVQGLVESVLDVAFGGLCLVTASYSLSNDPKFEAMDTVACGIVDNAVRMSNALFWLGVTGAERTNELLMGGSPDSVKGEYADLYKLKNEQQLIDLLTVGIPSGPAELMEDIKQQAIVEPLQGLSRGVINIGGVEIGLDQIPNPFDIVKLALEANGDILVQNPALFVANTAEEVARQSFDAIVPLVIDTLIESAGKLDFVDQDGHQVFGMGLKNDGTGTGLNAMGFNVNGTEMMSISEGDVCMNGLCISTIGSFINSLPGDFPEQINGLKDRVTAVEGLVPDDLDTQLSGLSSQYNTLNSKIPNDVGNYRSWIDNMWYALYGGGGTTGLVSKFSTLDSQFNTLDSRVPSDLISQLSTIDNTLKGYKADNVAGKANDLWELIYTNTGYFGKVDGGMLSRMNATTELLNAVNGKVDRVIATLDQIRFGVPCPPIIPCISDARVKTNVSPLNLSLNKILQLQGVSHSWNEDAAALGIEDLDRTVLGFIAQDVQQVVPELVTEAADGYLRLDYGKMAPLMVEGIKEQQTQIAYLQHENAQLKGYLCSMDPAAPFCAN